MKVLLCHALQICEPDVAAVPAQHVQAREHSADTGTVNPANMLKIHHSSRGPGFKQCFNAIAHFLCFRITHDFTAQVIDFHRAKIFFDKFHTDLLGDFLQCRVNLQSLDHLFNLRPASVAIKLHCFYRQNLRF